MAESLSRSASEAGDNSSVFDETEESEYSEAAGETGEEGADSDFGDETTPVPEGELRRVDSISQFEQGVGVEVALDSESESEGDGPAPPHLSVFSGETAEAAGEFLADTLCGIDTPQLRVHHPSMAAPALPLPPCAGSSSADGREWAETSRGTMLGLSVRRVDTMDLLRVPGASGPSPCLGMAWRAAVFPVSNANLHSAANAQHSIPPVAVRQMDSLDLLTTPGAAPLTPAVLAGDPTSVGFGTNGFAGRAGWVGVGGLAGGAEEEGPASKRQRETR